MSISARLVGKRCGGTMYECIINTMGFFASQWPFYCLSWRCENFHDREAITAKYVVNGSFIFRSMVGSLFILVISCDPNHLLFLGGANLLTYSLVDAYLVVICIGFATFVFWCCTVRSIACICVLGRLNCGLKCSVDYRMTPWKRTSGLSNSELAELGTIRFSPIQVTLFWNQVPPI